MTTWHGYEKDRREINISIEKMLEITVGYSRT